MSFIFGGGSAKPAAAPPTPSARNTTSGASAASTAALLASQTSGFASTIGKSSGLGDTRTPLTSTAKLLGLSYGGA